MADIKKELNAIKNAVYGKEVRGSIHDGIKKINDEVENATDLSESAKHQVENIQQQVNQLVVEGDSSVEAAQARVDAEGKTFPTLKARLDEKETQFSSQLAQTMTNVSNIAILSSDYPTIQDAIDATPENGLLKITSTENLVNLEITKPITIDFNFSKLKYNDVQRPVIKISGSRSDISYQLANDLQRGATQLPLTSVPTDIEAGDFIILRDDKTRPSDGSTDINLEVHKVKDVIDSNIILEDFVRLPKSVSPSNVYRIDLLKNVNILNIDFEGVEGVPLESPVIFADMTENLHISNINAEKTIAPVIKISRSYNYKVSNFKAKNPLAVGSGQGYGIRVDGGSMKGEFRTGEGNRLRHLIDCGNAFDNKIYDFYDYSSTTSSFVFSHNGFDNNNEFINCNSYNTEYIGFNASAQGLEDRFDQTLHNLRIDKGYVSISEDALPYAKGLSFLIPVKGGHFKNFKIEYLGDVEDSRGVEMTPVYNDVVFEQFEIKGAHYGFHFNKEGSPLEKDPTNTIKLKQGRLTDCFIGIEYRSVRNIYIEDVVFDNVEKPINLIYHIDPSINEKLHYLYLKNIYVKGTDIDSFMNWTENARPSTGIRGIIDNITLEGLPTVLNMTEGKEISFAEYLFYKKNGMILMKSESDITTNATHIVRNILEGEVVTFVNVGENTITIPGGSWVRGGAVLEPGQSVKYIGSGQFWIKIS